MSEIAIQFENISKQYKLGLVNTGTLKNDIIRWWTTSIKGKEDPFHQIGETNRRDTKGKSDYVWALSDINFEVPKGEVLGIIGKNGAGKSTLLKILSNVTAPTTGVIRASGRIASLLEVGTGFHPELTGRENIFMNGAILGMSNAEIKSKLDEIIDFSGVERYIDTPVKRYSTGMTVRLGFAIAAHLESEILVVDEVLAVGDAEFQKKAIGKMQDVTNGKGRTVLFVSHNMGVISLLCKNTIILQDGTLRNIGPTEKMINEYMSIGQSETGETNDYSEPKYNQKLKIRAIKVLNEEGKVSPEINNANKASIEIQFEVLVEGKGYDVGMTINHAQYGPIFGTTLKDIDPAENDGRTLAKGNHTFRISLPIEILRGGDYWINAAASIPKFEMLDEFKFETRFSIIDSISPVAKNTEGRSGAVLPVLKWIKAK